jgi:single-stranded DNA-binding protein
MKYVSKLEFSGNLTKDPTSEFTSQKNKLKVTFTVANRPRKDQETVFMSFTCLVDEVSEYILANFRKGSFIHVVRAEPRARTTGEGKERRQHVTWLAWEVAGQEATINNESGSDDDDLPPY